MSSEKHILLIISGGIAAYKTLEVIRRLRERSYVVRAILTKAGAQFVTPLSVAALTGQKVYEDLFSLTDEAEMGHIRLSREADLIVVAPATANVLAKTATGLCDDLASTLLLATDAPILAAPAMNVRMWQHPATQANLTILRERGMLFVGPEEGEMACGEYGPGRMAEPETIIQAIEARLTAESMGMGLRALVTAGPTREAVDPVRYLSNHSSGRQGYAIATALAARGMEVVLISGPSSLPDPPGMTTVRVESAQQMLTACEAQLPVDVAVCAAAVSDWQPVQAAAQKIKKRAGGACAPLELTETPDILHQLSNHRTHRPRLVVGFAAETEQVTKNAAVKRQRKGCDWILANDVSPKTGVFGGEDNRVHLIDEKGAENWPRMKKREVADRLASRILGQLKKGISSPCPGP